MKKHFVLILSLVCVLFLEVNAQHNRTKIDTTYVSRLTPKESRIIRNLVNTDSSFVPTHINLQLELFKYDANLLYKYRLDSINSAISLDYNPYVQSYIDAFLTQRKNQIGKMLSLGDYYFPIFEQALKKYNVPEELKYLPIVESSMDPHAVSKSGATGLWQFMFTTAKGYGLSMDNYIDERKDPIKSSYAAAVYLKDAYNSLGDWLLAIASYNCGVGAVSRALIKAGGEKKTFWEIQHLLPKETQDYIPKFIAVTYMMSYYNRHKDIKIPDVDFKMDIDSVYVNKFVSFDSLADVLNIENKELQILNPSYKKNVINGSIEHPKRLIIPKVDFTTYASIFEVLNPDKSYTATPASSTVIATSSKPTAKIYVVKKGESLLSIANKNKVEVQDLKVWNKLKSSTIVPGQKLTVQSNNNNTKEVAKKTNQYLTYKVKYGDTLSSIAKNFNGVSIETIKSLNNLAGGILAVGEILKIKVL